MAEVTSLAEAVREIVHDGDVVALEGFTHAGASGLPFGVLRGYAGTDLVNHTSGIAPATCPFTGENLTAVSALRPGVSVIHAQQVDRKGNVGLWGIQGVQKEAILAVHRSITGSDLRVSPDLESTQPVTEDELNALRRLTSGGVA